MWAEDTESVEMVQILLEKEAGLQDNEGLTALMWAAKSNRKSAYILAPYEIDKVNNQGKKASQLAREAGHNKMADYLEKREQEAQLKAKKKEEEEMF